MNEESINPDLEPTRFHFFNIRFVPLKEHENLTNRDIITRIVEAIQDQRARKQIIVFDRHLNRKNEPKRQLYVNYTGFELQDHRIKLSMALIRDGKLPYLKPTDSIELVPFDKELGEPTEITHFYIDYRRSPATVCVEYNHIGPRFTDIQYYFRAMGAFYLNLTKALHCELLMENDIEDTIKSLAAILDFDMKIEAKKISQMDNDVKGYLSEWATLSQKYQPEYVRVLAYFQRNGVKMVRDEKKSKVTEMVKFMLKAISTKTENLEAFDRFVINYEDTNGKDQAFNLYDSKSEFLKYIDLSKNPNTTQIYKIIKQDFDDFLKNRYNG